VKVERRQAFTVRKTRQVSKSAAQLWQDKGRPRHKMRTVAE